MANVIDEEPREFANPDAFESQVREYAQVSDSLKMLETRRKELHGKLMSKLEADGEEDDNGNIVLTFDNEIGGLKGLVKTRRVSRKVDLERALEIIKEHELEEELVEMVPQIREDAIMAALYEGTLNENEVDQMFPSTVTWALNTKK
jgi:hypothetical protein